LSGEKAKKEEYEGPKPQPFRKKRETEEDQDLEEFRDFLRIVREEVGPLLKDLVEPLKEILGTTFTPEEAKDRAKSIAVFYKELTEAGMDKESVLRIIEKNFTPPTELIKSVLEQIAQRKK